MRFSVLGILLVISLSVFSQENNEGTNPPGEGEQKPLFSDNKIGFLNNVTMSMNMRGAFRNYYLRGGYHNYEGHQFENEYTAFGISARIHDKVKINFRNRFNKETEVQSLDQLSNNIELANIEVEITPDLELQVGRQDAYFGGYEYSFFAIEIQQYNDIQSNALAYVTGVGLNYDVSKNHNVGFQVLNSRTQHYADKYGDNADENIREPDWPVEVVGNWRAAFLTGNWKRFTVTASPRKCAVNTRTSSPWGTNTRTKTSP